MPEDLGIWGVLMAGGDIVAQAVTVVLVHIS
jgi:hypothetical protein